LIEKEYQAMGLPLSVENIPVLREPIDRARAEGEARGRAEGRAHAIERVLQARFPGEVPVGLAEHLSDLPPEVLDQVLETSATAGSVEDALGSYTPARGRGRNG
jgi:hypothetical protein